VSPPGRGRSTVGAVALVLVGDDDDDNGGDGRRSRRPHPDPASYAEKFTGRYAHRLIAGGVGHNLPQEAPEAFAESVVEVDGY
jgi:pimeloyl-ACP methyl ester carboxylesterase